MDMSLSKLQETVKAREAWCASVHSVRCWAWEMLAQCRGGAWRVPLGSPTGEFGLAAMPVSSYSKSGVNLLVHQESYHR